MNPYRQELAQALSLPQFATHCVLYSVQMKYGIVCEYSVALGDNPLAHTHE